MKQFATLLLPLVLMLAAQQPALAATVLTGTLNGGPAKLDLVISHDQQHLFGTLGQRATDLTVQSTSNLHQMTGLVDGSEVDFKVSTTPNIIKFVGLYNKNTADFQIERKDYVSDFSGKMSRHNLSTRITYSSDRKSITVTGFYQGRLADLMIYRQQDTLVLKGYINDSWVHIVVTATSSQYLATGTYNESPVDLTITRSDLSLSNILEIIFFGIYVPHVNLLLL